MSQLRALLAEREGGDVTCTVTDLDEGELGDGDVLIDVEWSGLNYKDALAIQPKGGVTRMPRLVPGIDMAGTVRQSTDPSVSPGDRVLAHGYGIGVSHNGGFAAAARLPAAWVLALPAGLSARDAMTLGTAGFTAALSVAALVDHGVAPGGGPVLVSGATGGVGSAAVAMLARLGYEVVASSGKAEARPWLESLGAGEVIGREELSRPGKPLEEQRWAGAVDCVGGATLAGILRSLRWGGAVAASGLTGGPALETTVMPFILRSVALLGIDSVEVPLDARRAVWDRMAGDLRPADLGSLVAAEIGLDGIVPALGELLGGRARGRYLVHPA